MLPFHFRDGTVVGLGPEGVGPSSVGPGPGAVGPGGMGPGVVLPALYASATSFWITNVSSEISTSSALSDVCHRKGAYVPSAFFPTYPRRPPSTPRATVSLIASGFVSRGNCGDAK